MNSDSSGVVGKLSPRLRKEWDALAGSARPDARRLLAMARRLSGQPDDEAPRIARVSPARAAWGERLAVTLASVAGDVRIDLRLGDRVLRLAATRVAVDLVEVALPEPPDRIAESVRGELFASTSTGCSEPVLVELRDGPVLRQGRPTGPEDWLLTGAGFGSDADAIRIVLPAGREARLTRAAGDEIAFTAALADRTPVRIVVAGRASNTLQLRSEPHGRTA